MVFDMLTVGDITVHVADEPSTNDGDVERNRANRPEQEIDNSLFHRRSRKAGLRISMSISLTALVLCLRARGFEPPLCT